MAANAGLANEVEALIGAGEAVDSRTSVRETPIMYAARNGYHTVVSMLLAAGANASAINSGGFSALHAAVRVDHAEASRRQG